MSEQDDILGMDKKSHMAADITYLMLKGAGYAAVFVLALWFIIAAMAFIGRILPEASRDTPDPINRSSIELVIEETATV